jgi:very-short-patch-repair endonuclease
LKTNTPQEDHIPPPLPRDRARELRQTSTDAEYRLWSPLRNRGLGIKFRRQHPIGPYIVDFFSLEAKVVVELDGGHHNEDGKRRADDQRTRFLESRGCRILRFWNNEVLQNTDAVLTRIADLR